jgi:hypothetical protein
MQVGTTPSPPSRPGPGLPVPGLSDRGPARGRAVPLCCGGWCTEVQVGTQLKPARPESSTPRVCFLRLVRGHPATARAHRRATATPGLRQSRSTAGPHGRVLPYVPCSRSQRGLRYFKFRAGACSHYAACVLMRASIIHSSRFGNHFRSS